MRVFLDTEFVEDGKTIYLISVGLVREDGRTYYAQAIDWHPAKASAWVVENVFPHLQMCGAGTIEAALAAHRNRGSCSSFCPWRSAGEMQRQIVQFCGERPEFWADHAAYDWVALCQIFGRMADLPKGFPMFCLDVQQLRAHLSPPPAWPKHPGKPHFALDDAQDCRNRYTLAADVFDLSVHGAGVSLP